MFDVKKLYENILNLKIVDSGKQLCYILCSDILVVTLIIITVRTIKIHEG